MRRKASSKESFEAWVKSELNHIVQAQRKFYEAKGYIPFYKFAEGETSIKLLQQQPIPNQRYSDNMNFAIEVNGTDYTWSVNTHSPLYRQLLETMQNGITDVIVIRKGIHRQTRWSLKTLN